MSNKRRWCRPLVAFVACWLLIPLVSAECLEDDLVEECQEQVCIGQIFVELVPGFPVEGLLDPLGPFGDLFLVDEIPQLRFYLLGKEIPGGQNIEDVIDPIVEQLKQLETRVERAEAHRHLETPEGVQLSIPDLGDETAAAAYPDQPATETIHTGPALARYTGAGVTVAIIDTGMSFDHPQTSDRILKPGADFAGGDGTGQSQPNGENDDGDTATDESLHHATFIAGLVHLAAPDARILPIRALETDGKGTAFGVAKAIFHAIDSGVDVINLSHGMLYDSRAVSKAVEDAVDAGIVVVVAAGNRGEPIVHENTDNGDLECISFPASHEEVIAVAAVDENLVRTAFSDFGPGVDVSAPGVQLASTFGDTDFAFWSGTSFAAPFVAGAVALILDKYPCLTPDEVRTLLMNTAQPDNNPPDEIGAGVVDLDALTLALTTDRCSLALEQTPMGTVATWSPVAGAATYDLARGDLANLVVIPGTETDVVDLGPLACLVDDSVDSDSVSAPDEGVPAPGQVQFYLFRDDTDPYYGADSDGHPRAPGVGDCGGGP